MILEHVLQYQASYEMSIRTMYALNVAQARQHTPVARRPSSPTTSTTPPGSPIDTTAQFTASLMAMVLVRHEEGRVTRPATSPALVYQPFACGQVRF